MIMTKEQIQSIIPHREPMLLIDSIVAHQEGKSIEARFHVDEAWDIFRGHFPGSPVLPGVLAVESMAQASDVLLLSQPAFAGKIPYFIGIDKVKFKSMILPGDEIEIHAAVLRENTEKAIVTCAAKILNKGVLAVEGEVTLAMR
ncbi:MAG: 3-hydroxyacyl-ACP dehydratase FabZ [Clostridiales Family XIII bacterium]|nr:3-hydroxyacyl-ACP dehydratase FabZ [Clostridiales Family XIII bacterium]